MRLGVLTGLLGLFAACAPIDDESTTTSAIYHGTAEVGEPWVVAVSFQRPNSTTIRLCSGMVIGAREVLTAKHCVFDEPSQDMWVAVDVSRFVISVGYDFVGAGGIDHTVGAVEVLTTPGVYKRADREAGRDIAILRAAADIGVAPVAVSRTAPAIGDSVAILGFGYTETNQLGVKHRATATVNDMVDGVFTTTGAAWTCTGDSGGPALHLGRNQVLGITSYGPANCTTSTSFYTRVDMQLTMIDSALGLACTPKPELCNGLDDDCDGVVDQGCGVGPLCDGGSCDPTDDPGGCSVVRSDPASAPGSAALVLWLGVAIAVGRRRRARARSRVAPWR